MTVNSAKQKEKKGTVRQLVWCKTNPSPMNGQHIYLSGIENAVWFKKRGGVFNARCKNTVFNYPCGRSKLHPTEKNHDLLKELILDNSQEGDLIFDPCMGSGHILVYAFDVLMQIYENYGYAQRDATRSILQNNIWRIFLL